MATEREAAEHDRIGSSASSGRTRRARTRASRSHGCRDSPGRMRKPRGSPSAPSSLSRAGTMQRREWLAYSCRTGTDDRTNKLIARLATDPRWAGDPFRRVIDFVAGSLPRRGRQEAPDWPLDRTSSAIRADCAGSRIPLRAAGFSTRLRSSKSAVRQPTANADDWLRLALARSPGDLNAARGKISPAAYAAAAAVLRATPQGKDFEPVLANAVEKRLFVQSCLAVNLSRGKPDEAAVGPGEVPGGQGTPEGGCRVVPAQPRDALRRGRDAGGPQARDGVHQGGGARRARPPRNFARPRAS